MDINNKIKASDKINQVILNVIVAIVLAGVFIGLISMHSITVKGQSMEPTLSDGDKILISKIYGNPSYGDVVIIIPEKEGVKNAIVKRIVATEGQTIDITSDGIIKVDGIEKIDEFGTINIGNNFCGFPYTVPENCVFVLGDNRNNSYDSRCFGAVNINEIYGKVICRISPFKML